MGAVCERYQGLVNGSLEWSTALAIDPARETKLLIALVRRVRNNLLHGGKYQAALYGETARSEELLRGGLRILEAFSLVPALIASLSRWERESKAD